MQVHIWPSRTRPVLAANAAINVQASWVGSSVGTGVVWKWSYTQIDSHGPASARCASLDIVFHCWAGSTPTRSNRQPCGMKTPNLMVTGLNLPADLHKSRRVGTFGPCGPRRVET